MRDADRYYIEFEILGGMLSDAEHRLGDVWVRGVMGFVAPYATVEFIDPFGNIQTGATGVVMMSLGKHSGCSVNFEKRMSFTAYCAQQGEQCIRVRVFQKRFVQAVFRGDPMVGEATLSIDMANVGSPQRARLSLSRPAKTCFLSRGRCCGDPVPGASWLDVQCRVVAWETVGNTLAACGQHRLADVLLAIATVLRAPGGLARLLETRPCAVGFVESGSEASSRRLRRTPTRFATNAGHTDLQALVSRLCAITDSLQGHESDDEIFSKLRQLSRGILVYVATYVSGGAGAHPSYTLANDSANVACQWIRDFITACAQDHKAGGSDVVPPMLDEAWLRKFLSLGMIDRKHLVPVDENLQDVRQAGWCLGKAFPENALLGAGSYGSVGRARDAQTGALCAVKLMVTKGPVKHAVAKRECQVAEALRERIHPCVVRVFDFDHHRDACSCALVMEFCPGGDLMSDIRRRRNYSTYEASPLAVEYLTQVFLALEFLHLTVGMLCRDVKPENVLLSADRCRAMLTDFGMSRLDTVSDGDLSFSPNVPPGTPAYVAPEVLRGVRYDYHADFYSLGVLALVLLSGGLKGRKHPTPPCGTLCKEQEGQGLSKLGPLLGNWLKVRSAVVSEWPPLVQPITSQPAQDFILSLTDRSKEHRPLSHVDVRDLALLRPVAPPPLGDDLATDRWLRSLSSCGSLPRA